MTCDRPDNCYTHKMSLKRWPEGKRLDYVLYQSGKSNFSVFFPKNSKLLAHIELVECENRFDKIPDSKLNYSDHSGVYAKFEVHKGKFFRILPFLKLKKSFREIFRRR